MLTKTLGYEEPRADEIAAAHAGRDEADTVGTSDFEIPAAVLHGNPLLSYSGSVLAAPLGLASVAPAALRDRDAWFLVSPTWSIETDEIGRKLRLHAVRHRLRNPRHRIVFVCNTPEETEIMRSHNEAAFFFNKTANVRETTYQPLDGERRMYDAIYNAQLVPWKRHELSLGIERCAFVFYRSGFDASEAASQAAILARHAKEAPGHVFINKLDRDGKPIRLSLPKVNRHLNRAAVGLCLSEEEGAMFASTEYLLAGLPIVSTPSRGGRHVYFDEEYCWTVPPDPAAVAEAVRVLTSQAIPPSYIRAGTLRRIEADRERFLGLLNAIFEESGLEGSLAMPWPFQKPVTMEWQPPWQAVDQAVVGDVDGFWRKREKKGAFGWRQWLSRRFQGSRRAGPRTNR